MTPRITNAIDPPGTPDRYWDANEEEHPDHLVNGCHSFGFCWAGACLLA